MYAVDVAGTPDARSALLASQGMFKPDRAAHARFGSFGTAVGMRGEDARRAHAMISTLLRTPSASKPAPSVADVIQSGATVGEALEAGVPLSTLEDAGFRPIDMREMGFVRASALDAPSGVASTDALRF